MLVSVLHKKRATLEIDNGCDLIFRVSVRGVKSLGGHFACLCRGFQFYEVKENVLLLFLKKEMVILLHFLSFL